MRGVTMTRHEDESDLKAKIRQEMIGLLAREWNDLNRKLEIRSFQSPEDRDDENDYLGMVAQDAGDSAVCAAERENPAITDEEKAAVRMAAEEAIFEKANAKWDALRLRMEAIEELLSDLGARMMRPYEHHNELERHIEWMENRYPEDDR